MHTVPEFLARLGLGADTDVDEKQVKRAYARLLKQIDQETEPQKFQQLREDYRSALDYVQLHAILGKASFEFVAPFDPPQARVPLTGAPDEVPERPAAEHQDRPEPKDETTGETIGEASGTANAPDGKAEVPPSFLNPMDLAYQQIEALRHEIQRQASFEVHELLRILNQCLDREELFGLEARAAFETALLSGLVQGDWGRFSGPLLCAGNLCFRWNTTSQAQFSLLTGEQARQLESLLDDVSRLDTLSIDSWFRWAKVPNATPVQSLLAVKKTREKYPVLSHFFFDASHIERLETEEKNQRRPFEQFKRQVLTLEAPGIAQLTQMLRPFAGDSTFETLLVHAIANRHFDQASAALLFAAKGVFQWRSDNTDVVIRYGAEGEKVSKILVEVGSLPDSSAGNWVRWAQSATPSLAREARLKIELIRANYPHACSLFFPQDYLRQLHRNEKLNDSWGARSARLWDKLNPGGAWNVFGNLLVIAVVVGLVFRLFNLVAGQETVKNAGQCDTQIAAGIENNWEKMSAQQLTELRRCLDIGRLPAMCSDRRGLQELWLIQGYVGDRYAFIDPSGLVYKPGPGRMYEFAGTPTCRQHEQLVFNTEWMRAIDKTTLANSVKALGRCSVEPGASVSSNILASTGQNGQLFLAALKLTKEWQAGAGKVFPRAVSFEELITPLAIPVFNWNAENTSGFESKEPCLITSSQADLLKAEVGPKETEAILQRSKLKSP